MSKIDFILYGAYGYTGRLITEGCAEAGLRPLLSGRSEEKLKPLAEEFGFEYRTVDLNDGPALRDLLQMAPLVLHCAGPFTHTAAPMMDACLETSTHYLDITGEIEVFEAAHKLDPAAKTANILIMPGVGFDVVPTDCTAAYLHQQLPDAEHLLLAFSAMGGGMSRGTAKTMVEGMGRPGAVRRNGRITPVPAAYKTREVEYQPGKPRFSVTIPWGDVSTAYYTTGIDNIETYTSVHPKAVKMMRLQYQFGWLFRMNWVRQIFRNRIDNGPAGPDAERRETGRSYVYGEVWNDEGEKRAARITTVEGYRLTAATALLITGKVLAGDPPIGHHTPAGAYGPDLILEIPGSTREDVSVS